MDIYSIYILNKAGGLIYQNDVAPGVNKLSANDYLVLAGTLHGVHAIASKLKEDTDPSPPSTSSVNAAIIGTGRLLDPNTNKSGLQSIETDNFNLYVFQTLSGIKFVIITSPNPVVLRGETGSRNELQKQTDVANELFRKLYVAYSDFVMKDPFYLLDMPIKSILFDKRVREVIN